MECFIYNNINYSLNEIVLLKYRSRILKYKIIHINLKLNEYYNVKFQSILYENVIHTIKYNIGTTHKFIKKFIICNEPPNILCKTMRKKQLIYSFHCDFCNKIHKHNYLGHNDCRCNCVYSPYYSSGYNLVLENKISNFNDYLLYNLELYLKKNKYSGWCSYRLSVKKFYNGEVCEDYGKTHFPYLTDNMIYYIKTKYHTDNIQCSNGCLVAGLKYLIKMILNKTILYEDLSFKNDLTNLYRFYKKKSIAKNTKIDLLKKIIKPINNTTNTIINNCNLQKTVEPNKTITQDTEEDIEEIEEIINMDNINIELDLMCGLTHIENLSMNHINNIKNLISIDFPYYKDKYFYYPEDVKIYSKYLDIYDDLYLCISKLETIDNITVFCVDEADCYDPDFINFKFNK